ncbi:S-layer homology domain-containing protein [Paenibacillus cisolokensis]|uniref:CAP and S-layer homology domain-containing protein n=1 Tax=Paenibacillus cisolokensis TaxID=1658519 RepID=UPI003D2B91B1
MHNRRKGLLKYFSLAAGSILLSLWLPHAAFAEPVPVDSLLPERSEKEIAAKWNQWMKNAHDAGDGAFAEIPSSKSPYRAGKLKDGYLEKGLNAANFYRFVSGLPADLVLDESLNRQAQHGAVTIAANGRLTHNPVQPEDMPQDFFELGEKSAGSSNIYWTTSGTDNVLVRSVEAYMDDSDSSNIDRVGHRRWILSPQLKRIGFGLAAASNGKQDGYYSAMQVFDQSREGQLDFNYILYPNKGAFPLDVFEGNQAWSVHLNPSRFQQPELSDVRVELTRLSDRKTWVFDEKTRKETRSSSRSAADGLYFNVDTARYGYTYGIIFRPDETQLIEDGERFAVRITGLKKTDGTDAEIAYETRFFRVEPIEKGQLTGLFPEKAELSVKVGSELKLPAIHAVYENGLSVDVKSKAAYKTDSDKIRIQNGAVMGLKPGQADIVVRYEGRTATLRVNVYTMPAIKDITGHWAEEQIRWAVEREMVKGYADGTFKPNKQVSEAEFLAMLFTLYADDSVIRGMDRTGKPSKSLGVWSDRYYWYAKRLNLDVDKSVMDARRRNRAITRAEVAQIVAGLSGKNYANDDDAIRFLLNMGFSSGKTSATVKGYAGKDRLTRAEAIVFLKNLQDQGFRLTFRPTAITVMTENEKKGGLPDRTVKVTYQTDRKLIVRGAFAEAANRTIKVEVHASTQDGEHIETLQTKGDAYGNFTVTFERIDADDASIYVSTRDDLAYYISAKPGQSAIVMY